MNTAPLNTEVLNAPTAAPDEAVSVSLSWTNPADDDLGALRLYRGEVSGFTREASTLLHTVPDPVPGASASYTDDGSGDLSAPSAGTTYYYALEAEDESGNVSVSNEASAAPPGAAPTLSGAAGAATGEATAEGSVTTDEGNGTLYAVVTTSPGAPTKAQVKAGQDAVGSAAAWAGSQAVSATGAQGVSSSGLSAATTYYFHYMHEDEAGNQSAVASSPSFTTETASAGTLAAPTLNAAGASTSEVSLAANAVDGADTYEFQAADDAAFTTNATALQDTSSTTAEETGLSENDVRYYRCRAKNAEGAGPWSIIRKATAKAPVYPADEYAGMATGVGLHKLRSDYAGDAIRVRRLSDDAETDIGFRGHELDIEALETFAQGGDVVVTRLYEQAPGETGHYEPDGTFDLPLICVGGQALLDEATGRPYMDMQGQAESVHENYFVRSAPLSTPVDRADSAPMLCLRMYNPDSAGSWTGGWGPARDAGTLGALGTNWGHFASAEMNGDAQSEELYVGERFWGGGRFGGSDQALFAGADTVRSAEETVSGDYNSPDLLAGYPWELSEAIIWMGVANDDAYRARLWAADDYWECAPTQAMYEASDLLPCNYRWQGELIKWIASQSAEDFVAYKVASVDTNEIVVEGEDWTFLPDGHEVWAHDSIFTLNGAPALSGVDTVLAVNEDTSGLKAGQQVVYKPLWDETYEEDEEAANLDLLFSDDGDTTPAFGLPGRAEPGWYALDTGEPAVEPAWDDWAVVDEANPDATGAQPETLEVRGTSSDRKIALFEVSLAALTQIPTMLRLALYNGEMGDEDGVKPYLGAKVYADLAWDSATLTWNTLPAEVDLDAAYDDIEGLDDGGEEEAYITLYLREAARAAYGAGASTLTIMLYHVSDQYNSSETGRTLYIDSPSATNPPETLITQARGLEATGDLRLPETLSGQYNYGMGRKPAWWTRRDLPLSDGSQGNPFYGNAALKRRALVVDFVNAIGLPYKSSHFTWTRYMGGYLWSLGETVQWAGDALPYEARRAAKQAMLFMAQIPRNRRNAGANANMDVKAAEGCAAAYPNFDENEPGARQWLVEGAKGVLLGSRNGDPAEDEYIWHREGNFYEGSTPEGSYNNRSMAHLVGARKHVWGEEEWDWLDTILKRMTQFQQYQFGYHDYSQRSLDCSGYSGRTTGAVLGGQYEQWAHVALGAMYPEGRWHLKDWSRTGDSRVPSAGADAAFSARSKIEGLPSMPINTSLPPLWRTASSWPSGVQHAPPPGWWSDVQGWHAAGDADLYPDFHPDSEQSNFVRALPTETGEEDWFIAKGGDSGASPSTRWGAFVETLRTEGSYSAIFAGVHMLWTEEYGVVVSTRRPGGGPATAPTRLVETVWGTDDKATPTHFWWRRGVSGTLPEVSYDEAGRSITHEFTGLVDPDMEEGDEIAPDAAWSLKRTYTALDSTGGDAQDGLQVDLEMSYTGGAGGADQVEELWWQWPLAVREVDEDSGVLLRVYFWDGDAWVRLVEGAPETAQEWKLVRVLPDETVREVWLRFDEAVACKLAAEESQGHTVALPFRVDLHGNPGTAEDIPASITRTLIVTSTDPGFKGSAISANLNYPEPGDVLPEGAPWAIQTEAEVPAGTSLDKIWFEYSDDDASSWTTLASLEVATGDKVDAGDPATIEDVGDGIFEYVGEESAIPSGLTHLRVRSESDTGDERTRSLGVTSAAPVAYANDSFTHPDGTVVDTSYELESGQAVDETTGDLDIQGNQIMRVSDLSAGFVIGGVGTRNHLVRATLPGLIEGAPSGTEYIDGLAVRCGGGAINGAYHCAVASGVMGIGDFWPNGGDDFTSKDVSLDASKTYTAEAYSVGDVVVFRVLDDQGGTVGLLAHFGATENRGARVGLRLSYKSPGYDDFEVETW